MKNTIKIPERLYYPLPDAARYIGCSVADIIHMGATGVVNISIYIPSWIEKDNERFMIFYNGLDVVADSTRLGDYLDLNGEGWSVSGIHKCSPEDDDLIKRDVKAIKFLSGFFYVSNRCLTELEFDVNSEFLKINTLYAGGGFYDEETVVINSVLGVIFPVKYLCLMAGELRDISSKVGKIPRPEMDSLAKQPNTNKQSKMIKALIELMYGSGSSEKARSLLNTERDTGEMLADFDKNGIKPPVSGKQLAEWLKDVELEYVEISSAKVETSQK